MARGRSPAPTGVPKNDQGLPPLTPSRTVNVNGRRGNTPGAPQWPTRAVTGHSLYSDGDDDHGKPKNPHQNYEKASRTPANPQGGFFSSRYTPNREEKKIPGETDFSHGEAKKASRTPVDHTSWSSDEPENPHQNCKKASRTCVVCGQAILQVSGQSALYCSSACKAKAYRQRWSSADTPGQGEPVPPVVKKATDVPDPSVCTDCGQRIEVEGFLYRCPPCLQARYDKLGREYPEKLIRWLEARAVLKGGH